MNVPVALYDPPSTAPIGLLLGAAAVVLGSHMMWLYRKSCKFELYQLAGAIAVISGTTMLGNMTVLVLVQTGFFYEVQLLSLLGQVTVIAAAVATLAYAIIKSTATGMAGAALLVALVCTTSADLAAFRSFQDAWGLATTMWLIASWIATVVFMTTWAFTSLRANERKKFIEESPKAVRDINNQGTYVDVV